VRRQLIALLALALGLALAASEHAHAGFVAPARVAGSYISTLFMDDMAEGALSDGVGLVNGAESPIFNSSSYHQLARLYDWLLGSGISAIQFEPSPGGCGGPSGSSQSGNSGQSCGCTACPPLPEAELTGALFLKSAICPTSPFLDGPSDPPRSGR
jgi:hypothetical protein